MYYILCKEKFIYMIKVRPLLVDKHIDVSSWFGIAIGSIMARIVKKEVDREKQKRLNIEIEKFSNEC